MIFGGRNYRQKKKCLVQSGCTLVHIEFYIVLANKKAARSDYLVLVKWKGNVIYEALCKTKMTPTCLIYISNVRYFYPLS